MNKKRFHKLLAVIHPQTGNKLFGNFEDDFKEYCEEKNYTGLIYHTTGEGDLLKLRELFYEEKPDLLIAAGGDGTVSLCGNAVLGTNTPLAIFAAGSTNGLAKELEIPLSSTDALDLIENGKLKTIDTLKINGKNSFHISDLGFNARILKRVSKSNIKGRLSYLIHSLREFFSYSPKKYEVITEDKHFKGKALMLIITNSRGFGYNLKVNPEGKIDDGIFEICIIRRFNKLHVFKMLYRVYSKTLHKSRYAKIIKAKKATIINIKSGEIHIDGEPVEMGKKITAEINPASLKILVPA